LSKGAAGEFEVVVRIGMPQYLQEIEFYACPFEIKGFGDVRTGYAAGIDAIQSLQLVMTMIGAKLEYLQNRRGDIMVASGSSQPGLSQYETRLKRSEL
jgi:hypothetical protein